MRKKLLALTLALASLGFMGSWSETKANAVTVTKTNPQIRIQIGRRRNNDRYNRRDYRRDYRYRDNGYNNDYGYNNSIQTRIVRDGWRTYRETYQVRYYPDGRAQTVLISRERIN